MLSDYERNYGFGTDALVRACSSNTNGIMVWAWMLWSAYVPPTQTDLWFAGPPGSRSSRRLRGSRGLHEHRALSCS